MRDGVSGGLLCGFICGAPIVARLEIFTDFTAMPVSSTGILWRMHAVADEPPRGAPLT